MRIHHLLEGIVTERYQKTSVALKQYRHDDDIFISYSDLPKLGINPRTKYNTPAGIYTYPLREIYDSVSSNTVPFAQDRRWVLVVRPRGGRILDVSTYGEADYRRDIQRLRDEVIPAMPQPPRDVDAFIADARAGAKANTPAAWIWNTTRLLAGRMPGRGAEPNPTVAWNVILRVGLGYDGVVDRDGTGLIHPNEPTQAVFLSRQALELVEIVRNKRQDRPSEQERLRDIMTWPTNILKMDEPSKREKAAALRAGGLRMLTLMQDHGIQVPRKVVMDYVAAHSHDALYDIKDNPNRIRFTTQDWQYIVSKNPMVLPGILRRGIPVDERVLITAAERQAAALGIMFKLGSIPGRRVIDAALVHHPRDAASDLLPNLHRLGDLGRELVPRIKGILNPGNDPDLDSAFDDTARRLLAKSAT